MKNKKRVPPTGSAAASPQHCYILVQHQRQLRASWEYAEGRGVRAREALSIRQAALPPSHPDVMDAAENVRRIESRIQGR